MGDLQKKNGLCDLGHLLYNLDGGREAQQGGWLSGMGQKAHRSML